MIFIYWDRGKIFECLTENWLDIGFLSYKYISVLEMSCMCDTIERNQEVVVKGEEKVSIRR